MKRLLAIALIAIEVLLGLPPAFAATSATVTDQPYELRRTSNGALLASNLPSKAACIDAAKARARTLNYVCRLNSTVVVTVTPDTPPPVPVDCVVSDWSAWSACSNGKQTRTRTVVTPASNGGAACPALSESQSCTVEPPPSDPPPPAAGTWTDLSSAPACAKVTVYPAKTVTDAAGAGIPIHDGRCLEATPATFTAAFWAGVKPGDVVYLHAGTYTGRWGEGTWYFANGETYKKGTAAQPIALVAYPGEAVTLDGTKSGRAPIVFGDGDNGKQFAEYITVAGMKLVGAAACLSGGGNATDPSGGPSETGGRYIRVVGVNCTITDATSNTMTGLIDLGNDGWKLLGNEFHDPANRVVINNNHGVYIQGGADDVEVAYNSFIGIHTGHVVQVHQDGTPKRYERISVHDNTFRATNYNDMRGISVVNVDDLSTVSVVNNTFSHLGWDDWGCLNVYGGTVTVDGLTCTDTHGGLIIHGHAGDRYGGDVRQVIMSNSKICPSAGARVVLTGQGVTAANLVETGAKACP